MFRKNQMFAVCLATLSTFAGMASAEINVIVDPELTQREREFAVQAIQRSERIFGKTFGFDFHPATRVVISGSPKFLAEQYVAFRGGNQVQKEKSFRDWITGEAVFRGIFLNTSSKEYHRKADTTINGNRQRMINHEFFHIMQYELIGPRSKKCCHPTKIPVVGPVWLIEGSASYYARKFEPSGMRSYLHYSRKKLRNLPGTGLKALETRKGMNDIESSSEIAAYAVSILVKKNGIAAVPLFYRELGRHGNWRKAFEAAFEQQIETFYSSLR